MAYTIYDASIPVMIRSLTNLSKILDKAVAQAKTEDKPLAALLEARLAPDMHPFPQQIQIASDAAKGAGAQARQHRGAGDARHRDDLSRTPASHRQDHRLSADDQARAAGRRRGSRDRA